MPRFKRKFIARGHKGGGRAGHQRGRSSRGRKSFKGRKTSKRPRVQARRMFMRRSRFSKGGSSTARAKLAFALSTKNIFRFSAIGIATENHGNQATLFSQAVSDPAHVSAWMTSIASAASSFPGIVAPVDTLYTKDWITQLEFTNQCNMSCEATAYLCVARKDVPLSETGFITIYNAGFADAREYTGSVLNQNTVRVRPFDNRRFCEYFKIVKVVKRQLETQQRMVLKAVDRTPRRWTKTSTQYYIGARNRTKFWVVTFLGQMCNDNTGAVGPVAPALSTGPIVLDYLVTEGYQWCVKDQDYQESYGPTVVTNGTTVQTAFRYTGATQGFQHAWNTYPVS